VILLETFVSIVSLFLLSVLCYWVSGIIHELGHIMTGLLHGWQFWMLVVGPIGIKKQENKIRLYVEKNAVLWGGAGGTLPADENADNVKIWSRVLLGGPVASIVTGVVFLSLYFLRPHIVFILLGAMPIAMGIACLLPFKTGITYSDGKRWARLRGGGQGGAEEISLFKMTMRHIFKKDAPAIELDDFSPLLQAELPALRYYGHYYLYQYYCARNDEENRRRTLETLHELKKTVSKIVVADCGV
jgi:hypothetical protein